MTPFRSMTLGMVVLLFLLVPILQPPVSADEIYPTITDIYFEKDGLPFNESLQFTVNCYGYACKSWDCGRDPEDLLARNGNFTPELVFSYHATCPVYGCRIYEPYYHAGRIFGTSCDLEGSTTTGKFGIRNFSGSPVPQNCTELHPFMFGKAGNRYYNDTPAYRRCINESRRLSLRCDQYLAFCDPVNDTDCRGWQVDGENFKETPSYRACRDTVDRERTDCDQFLEEIDPSKLVMWKYDRYTEQPAMRACEMRFVIPSNVVPATTTPGPAVPLGSLDSPIESLYCTLMSIFGARC